MKIITQIEMRFWSWLSKKLGISKAKSANYPVKSKEETPDMMLPSELKDRAKGVKVYGD